MKKDTTLTSKSVQSETRKIDCIFISALIYCKLLVLKNSIFSVCFESYVLCSLATWSYFQSENNWKDFLPVWSKYKLLTLSNFLREYHTILSLQLFYESDLKDQHP